MLHGRVVWVERGSLGLVHVSTPRRPNCSKQINSSRSERREEVVGGVLELDSRVDRVVLLRLFDYWLVSPSGILLPVRLWLFHVNYYPVAVVQQRKNKLTSVLFVLINSINKALVIRSSSTVNQLQTLFHVVCRRARGFISLEQYYRSCFFYFVILKTLTEIEIIMIIVILYIHSSSRVCTGANNPCIGLSVLLCCIHNLSPFQKGDLEVPWYTWTI
jgi:hypothetical protein